VLSLTGGTANGYTVSGAFVDDTSTNRVLGDAFSLVQFPVGQIVYSEADGKLYRNGKHPSPGAWDNYWTRAAVDAIDVTSDGSIVISADKITTGTLNAANVAVTNLNASNITSGTINAANVAVTNLNASNITSGTINADLISGGTLSGITLNITGAATFQNRSDDGTLSPAVVTKGDGNQGDVAAASGGVLHLGATSAASAGAGGTFTTRLQLENGFANFRNSVVEAKRFDVFESDEDVNDGTRRGTIRGSDTVTGRIVVERTAGSGDVILYVDGNVQTTSSGDLVLGSGGFVYPNGSTSTYLSYSSASDNIITAGGHGFGSTSQFIRTWADDAASGGTAPSTGTLLAGDLAVFTTAAPLQRIYWESSTNVLAFVTATGTSDIRMKENIIDYSDGMLDKVLAMRTVQYNYKFSDASVRRVGLIAQELREIEPSLVTEEAIAENDGNYKYVNDSTVLMPDIEGITALAISAGAIKELNAKVEVLASRIAELEAAD
jgi:hypothetical protein